jgi:hypothetical protein
LLALVKLQVNNIDNLIILKDILEKRICF